MSSTPKINTDLGPSIIQKHLAGLTDQQIADWLATLAPPVQATRLDVLRARQRCQDQNPLSEPSGAANRRTQQERKRKERGDQKSKAFGTSPLPKPCDNAERAHLWQLQRLLDLQMAVESDEQMTLGEKIRATTSISQAMGKISASAECEREADDLVKLVAQERAELREHKQKIMLAAKKGLCHECGERLKATNAMAQ
jgi:hypothetical protein